MILDVNPNGYIAALSKTPDDRKATSLFLLTLVFGNRQYST